MLITGNTLFAFVDTKDPFTPSEVADEQRLGPILSIMGARQFNFLFLFCTPHTRENAQATLEEVERRYQRCRVWTHELPVSDPKDYSSVMGPLAREVRQIMEISRAQDSENFVCVSSGTAEMRAAWFLLTAVGQLPAKLLQVGSPAEPLFGPANVREVRLGAADWGELRNLAMPRAFFELQADFDLREETLALPPPADSSDLEAALQELGIFVGSSSFRQAVESAAIAAGCDVPVLLLGETGTGKELVAKLVHRLSPRRARPLVPINCAAIPKELVESHLFGHLRGAFTGAIVDHKGKFEVADKSTLFLDEIGELTLDAQAKLLRVLENGEVEPVGSSQPRKTDVRIIAATNRNLKEEVKAGRFREDLYYRLEVLPIHLPPLRQRRAEIPKLAIALLKRINDRLQRRRQFAKETLQRLEQHDWPGNVRELSNAIERSILYSRSDVLEPTDLRIETKEPRCNLELPEPGPGFSLDAFLKDVHKKLILRALERSNGNQSAAAEMLGMTKQAISKFLKERQDNRS